jgi:transposase
MIDVIQGTQQAIWAEAEGQAREVDPTPSAPQPPPERAPRFQPVNRNQLVLRTVDVDRLVEPDHLVRAIWELVGQLDLKRYTAQVGSVEGVAGRPAYDPRLLISLWVYAYSEKVSSAREVERRCSYHPAYQWLTGCEIVNHHTRSDFRVQHQEALDELFAQLLGVLSSEELITLEQVVHDGTKVKAAASGNSFHREKTLRAHLQAARERVQAMGDPREEEPARRAAAARQRAAREKVERLEQALKEMEKVQAAPKARAEKSERRTSETDPEARIMKQSDGGHAPSHNVQISTDVAHGIIVGASVTQEANDLGQLVPALEEVQRQTGRLPQQLVVDDGYTTRENILASRERGVDLIGGTMQGDAQAALRGLQTRGVDPAFYPENFRYDAATHTYICPAGKQLPYRTTKYDRVGVERHIYKARAADCRGCAFRAQCRPGMRGRSLTRTEQVPEVAAYVAKMRTEAARALYRVRAPVAEFTNAWLKAKLGLRQFCVRGLRKVRCEVLWACLTYNIQQWFRLRWKVRLRSAPA